MNAVLLAMTMLAQPTPIYVSPILEAPLLGAHSVAVRIEGPDKAEFQLLERLTPAGKVPSRWRSKAWRVKLAKSANGLYAVGGDFLRGSLKVTDGTALLKIGEREIKLARVPSASKPVRLESEP